MKSSKKNLQLKVRKINCRKDTEARRIIKINSRNLPNNVYHFSSRASLIGKLIDENYSQTSGRKPRGLWYSYGNNWLKKLWENHNFLNKAVKGKFNVFIDSICQYKSSYVFDLNRSKMLIIRSKADFISFSEIYGVPGELDSRSEYLDRRVIDWRQVAGVYGGIEVKYNKLYEKLYWYHGWELTSGCIWDVALIKNFRMVWNHE